jgi:tyrosyl-tRNA synthetase
MRRIFLSLHLDLNGKTIIEVAAVVFKEAFGMEKSNGELRKQFIITGAVQLNGDKLTDPQAIFEGAEGQIFRLSKKQSVRLS